MSRRLVVLVAFALGALLSGATRVPSDALTTAQKTALAAAFQAMRADGVEHAACLDAEDRITSTPIGTTGSIDLGCDADRLAVLIHTHPQGASPSPTDIGELLGERYPILDRSIIQGSDGMVTVMDRLTALPSRTAGEIALIQSRYHLLEEVFALARPDAPPTRTWALARLCAGLNLGCRSGADPDNLVPLQVGPLEGVAVDPTPGFSPRLRAALQRWLGGAGDPEATWADVGNQAGSSAIDNAYLGSRLPQRQHWVPQHRRPLRGDDKHLSANPRRNRGDVRNPFGRSGGGTTRCMHPHWNRRPRPA